MSHKSLLCLSGTRYRCLPLYVPIDEFDPLSRLFLEVLEHEQSVTRLVKAFGLTERVVEDVLADLIRRNRAILVVQGGSKEIRLLDGALTAVQHEAGESLDVWQDDATGIILPAWIVDPLDQRHERGRTYLRPVMLQGSIPLVEGFLDAPDAQIIDMLHRSDEDLRHRDEGYSSLDRLTERYRVRPQTLWLPIVDADIRGQAVPLIVADGIPSWVTRVWSVTLRRNSLLAPGEEVGLHAEATSGDQGLHVVHGWRASARLGAWRDSVNSLITQVPPPLSGYDLRTVREKQATLAGLLLSLCTIELSEATRAQGESFWMLPVMDRARDWMAVMLPWPDQVASLITLVADRMEANATVPTGLFILVPFSFPTERAKTARETLQKIMGPTRFVSVCRRSWPVDSPAFALSDWPIVRLRFAPRSSVLQIDGGSFATEWLGIMQALSAIDRNGQSTDLDGETSDSLRRLRVRHDAMRLQYQLDARLGLGPDARLLAVALDELRGFGESLLTSIVDPELVVHSLQNTEDTAGTSEARIDRQAPLEQQVPLLREQLEILTHNLSLAPAPPWASWARLGFHDLLPTFASVLNEPSRRSVEGVIHILAGGLSEPASSPAVADLMECAVKSRWTIHLGVSRAHTGGVTPTVEQVMKELRMRVPSPRLRFWALNRPAPAHALILDDLVFIAGVDWLRSALDRQLDAQNFGFAFESHDLAESLRACFIDGAAELEPPSSGR